MRNFKKALAILLMLPIVLLFFVGVFVICSSPPSPIKTFLTNLLILAILMGMFGAGAHWLTELNKEK